MPRAQHHTQVAPGHQPGRRKAQVILLAPLRALLALHRRRVPALCQREEGIVVIHQMTFKRAVPPHERETTRVLIHGKRIPRVDIPLQRGRHMGQGRKFIHHHKAAVRLQKNHVPPAPRRPVGIARVRVATEIHEPVVLKRLLNRAPGVVRTHHLRRIRKRHAIVRLGVPHPVRVVVRTVARIVSARHCHRAAAHVQNEVIVVRVRVTHRAVGRRPKNHRHVALRIAQMRPQRGPPRSRKYAQQLLLLGYR